MVAVAWPETVQQRGESLLAVDDEVNALLDALQRHGELDRTLVIFTSDNGMMAGQHRLRNKYYPYEPSIQSHWCCGDRECPWASGGHNQ